MDSLPEPQSTYLTAPTPHREDGAGSSRVRSVWVAIGPWCGVVVWVALFVTLVACAGLLDQLTFLRHWKPPELVHWKGTRLEPVLAWVSTALAWLFLVFFDVTWSLGLALACLGRTAAGGADRPIAPCVLPRPVHRARIRRLALRQFLGGHVFVAELFLRFSDNAPDPRGGCLAMTSGCASTVTYGEVRRRELFHAMLVAWVLASP